MAKKIIGFPEEVDEVSARLVAAGVVIMTAVTLVSGQHWMAAVIMAGFWARVLTGPKLSPLGRFVTGFLRPRIPVPARPTAGTPKRFAQSIGATLSSAAVVAFALGSEDLGRTLISIILIAASLEAFAGYCLGCKIFALAMRAGLVPDDVCEACNDITQRQVPVG